MNPRVLQASCVLPARAGCAECPVWEPAEQALYWVDIPRGELHRFDPAGGSDTFVQLPDEVGSFAFLEGAPGAIAALRGGIAMLDADLRFQRWLHPARHDVRLLRLNDGKCDPAGRFWVGTMFMPRDRADARLYCVDPTAGLREIAADVIVSNGLAWSPDARWMYWSDTRNAVVYRMPFELASGTVGQRQVFARFGPGQGRPDGAATDVEGGYWSACFDGGQVLRLLPDGHIDKVVKVGARNVTAVAFGGTDLRTLYITTASEGVDVDQDPLAGALFALRVDVPGMPLSRYRAGETS